MNDCNTCANRLYKNGAGGPCAECTGHDRWIPGTPPEAPHPPSALERQEGGSHYKDYAIQPAEFIHKNGIEFLPGCVIKRMCRWRKKDGIKDLRKAIHEIELLIEMEQAA